MVLEQYFNLRWIEKKEHAFFLAILYSIIGFFSAQIIFPQSIGLMSIAFTSILLILPLSSLLKAEEKIESKEKHSSLKRLWKDHKEIFKVYVFIFLGIFLAFTIISLAYPLLSIEFAFNPQLKSAGISGYAAFPTDFVDIVENNVIVLLVALILSLAYGAGAILFLTWNASVWGIVFGYVIKQSAFVGGENILVLFVISIVPFLPHMIIEAVAYISAAIAGGVVSKAVLREEIGSKKFHRILKDAYVLIGIGLLLVVIGAFIEVTVFG